MLRIRRTATLITGAILALAIAPSAFACQGEFPETTFARAVQPARFVVVATVRSGPILGELGTWVLTVDRVLRGRAPSRIVIRHPFSGDLCEINLVRGKRVVLAMTDPASVAYGVTFGWLLGSGGQLTDINLPGMVTDSPATLVDLAARIAALPPTDTAPSRQNESPNVLLTLGPGLLGAVIAAWKTGRRRVSVSRSRRI